MGIPDANFFYYFAVICCRFIKCRTFFLTYYNSQCQEHSQQSTIKFNLPVPVCIHCAAEQFPPDLGRRIPPRMDGSVAQGFRGLGWFRAILLFNRSLSTTPGAAVTDSHLPRSGYFFVFWRNFFLFSSRRRVLELLAAMENINLNEWFENKTYWRKAIQAWCFKYQRAWMYFLLKIIKFCLSLSCIHILKNLKENSLCGAKSAGTLLYRQTWPFAERFSPAFFAFPFLWFE